MHQARVTGMRAFHIMLIGLFISALGSQMTSFGLAVWVFQETGSVTAFTTLIFFVIIPPAVGSLFAGPYVDRWNRRRIMIGSDAIASLSTLGIMLLFYTQRLQQWHLYIALTISGLVNSFFFPAFEASVPMLVSKEQLGRASGIIQSVSALVPILSSPLAGVFVTTIELAAIFIVDFTTFLLGILSLLLVLIPQPAARGDLSHRSFLSDLVFGLRYIWERKPFVYLFGILALFTFLNGMLGPLTGSLVLSFADAQALGLVHATFGLGALVGGVLLGMWGGPKRRLHGILMGMFVAGVGATIVGVRASVAIIAAGLFLFGAGYMFLNGLNRVIYQVKAAPDVLGRVFSLSAVVSLGAQSGGVLIVGPLITDVFEPLLVEDGAQPIRKVTH
jgi:DHA3 family macrolide efflux protein-like MFS transporter